MTVHRTHLARPKPPVHRRLLAALASRLGSERGDVPGWVLITLMTAGIVIALWAVASDQIVQIFENAMAPFLGGSL
ncbi:hypothetical protein NLU66_09470 [Brachybacterium sp. NBEC-018]|uniref:DUF4244 domain-containing protein n=1 Tax=Brachybacterium rhamnosum TaxID=173361 RepID=A0ABW4Q1W5_9MICO|nr:MULTISPECIES: hypothetical protein [unclassified Brachybacterium]QCR53656.1 hypothetical protein C1N80_08735 [Brachybacterium sp. SGAir0954]UVY82474.1 hypothetical protein NLU66_09470 [Brachybacterium sp. NBEC-018]